MVFLAKLQQKVQPTAEIQQGLRKLAQSSEFITILNKEVEDCKLDAGDVMAGVRGWVGTTQCQLGKENTRMPTRGLVVGAANGK